MIDWVPNTKSATGGSATDAPIVVTSLITGDLPRTNWKRARYRKTPSSGATTRMETAPAASVGQPSVEFSQ